MRQIPLGLGPSEAQSFDTFLAGANEALLEQLRDLLSRIDPPRPTSGAAGSGKTHLLRALAYAVQAPAGGWAGSTHPWPRHGSSTNPGA